MPKLNKTTVDAATVDKAKRYYVWDLEIKGFGLLVLPSGVKSYVYQYRTPEGRTRRATIGKHGSWTPDGAREKAKDWQEAVRAGGDPLGTKQAAKEAPTVGDVFDAYLKSGKFAEKAATTQSKIEGAIKRHLRPLLGKKYAHRMTADAVRRAQRDIATGKTALKAKKAMKKGCKPRGLARVQGGAGTARAAIRILKAILNWAVQEGLVKENPAASVKVGQDEQREAIIEDADGYARLFKALDKMEAEKRLRRPVADAVRVIALTGARRGEVRLLKWRHVDMKGGRLVIPRAEHKTGRSTGKPRVISLPALAQSIIARQPEGGPDDLVFTNGNGVLNLSKPWRAIREAAKLPEGIGLHGLRHSLASHMAMQGAQASAIMTALGHRQLSTAQRYVHWADEARAALAEKAAAVALAGMALAGKGEDEDQDEATQAGGAA